MTDLNKKVAIVTDGSRGIGAAISMERRKSGHQLAAMIWSQK